MSTQEKPPLDLDTGVWTVWIDDVDGELAMRRDASMRAKRSVEVCEYEVFERLKSAYESLKAELRGSEHRFGSTYAHQLEKETESLRRENAKLQAQLAEAEITSARIFSDAGRLTEERDKLLEENKVLKHGYNQKLAEAIEALKWCYQREPTAHISAVLAKLRGREGGGE